MRRSKNRLLTGFQPSVDTGGPSMSLDQYNHLNQARSRWCTRAPHFTPRTCCCTNKRVAGVCTQVVPSPLTSCPRDQDHFVDFFMVEYNGGMANMRRDLAPYMPDCSCCWP